LRYSGEEDGFVCLDSISILARPAHCHQRCRVSFLGVIVGVLLLIGTLFYRQVEGWGWLDSLYFCVITLATVGYGDFSPQTAAGKIFTMVYILLGIGTLVAVLTRLADALAAARRERD